MYGINWACGELWIGAKGEKGENREASTATDIPQCGYECVSRDGFKWRYVYTIVTT
jgi:hypothetical protein